MNTKQSHRMPVTEMRRCSYEYCGMPFAVEPGSNESRCDACRDIDAAMKVAEEAKGSDMDAPLDGKPSRIGELLTAVAKVVEQAQHEVVVDPVLRQRIAVLELEWSAYIGVNPSGVAAPTTDWVIQERTASAFRLVDGELEYAPVGNGGIVLDESAGSYQGLTPKEFRELETLFGVRLDPSLMDSRRIEG